MATGILRARHSEGYRREEKGEKLEKHLVCIRKRVFCVLCSDCELWCECLAAASCQKVEGGRWGGLSISSLTFRLNVKRKTPKKPGPSLLLSLAPFLKCKL